MFWLLAFTVFIYGSLFLFWGPVLLQYIIVGEGGEAAAHLIRNKKRKDRKEPGPSVSFRVVHNDLASFLLGPISLS